MVEVDESKLEEKLKEIEDDQDLRRAKLFVENFFSSLGSQSLDQAYLNYLDDLIRYSPTNHAIRNNSTYLCHLFGYVTNTDIQKLVELEYKHHGPPKIFPIDVSKKSNGKYPTLEDFFGPVISSYSAEDAVRDGVFMRIGRIAKVPIYITSSLYSEGYEDEDKLQKLLVNGLDMLCAEDPEDSDVMKLRVIKKNEIWVVLNGEGITFMKPGDY